MNAPAFPAGERYGLGEAPLSDADVQRANGAVDHCDVYGACGFLLGPDVAGFEGSGPTRAAANNSRWWS